MLYKFNFHFLAGPRGRRGLCSPPCLWKTPVLRRRHWAERCAASQERRWPHCVLLNGISNPAKQPAPKSCSINYNQSHYVWVLTCNNTLYVHHNVFSMSTWNYFVQDELNESDSFKCCLSFCGVWFVKKNFLIDFMDLKIRFFRSCLKLCCRCFVVVQAKALKLW